MEPKNPLMDDYVLELSGAERPRICFLPTASGDADHYVVRFYRRFGAGRSEPSHVSLFRRDTSAGSVEGNLEDHLLSQDVIYVGGGSLKSLLGAWRAHGLDRTLRRAWEKGVVLCGLSAGSLCWFQDSVTAFHGPSERVKGLGLLPHSNCVHYDGEPERRAAYRQMVGAGLRSGFGVEDGAALSFVGTRLDEVVTSKPDATAYEVGVGPHGQVHERRMVARYLGDSERGSRAVPDDGAALRVAPDPAPREADGPSGSDAAAASSLDVSAVAGPSVASASDVVVLGPDGTPLAPRDAAARADGAVAA